MFVGSRAAACRSSGTVAAVVLTALLPVLFCAAPASAKPMYAKQLAAYYGEYIGRAVGDCSACHLSEKQVEALRAAGKEPAEEKPWNAYGKSLRRLGDQQRKDTGKRGEILDRIKALVDADADADGVPNELEMLAGFFPGDPASKPSAQAVEAAKAARERFRVRYDWKPFDPPTRPAVPKVKSASWVRTPIDTFIAAEHEARGLLPRPPAPAEVLLRRVYLDLIGLPPTPEQLREFLSDPSPDAYEKVVDRLLASRHYGERWGRHWMDIWRYADQDERRLSGGVDIAPHMWRWRDWIIKSLNADAGYDLMLRQMLAGDELPGADSDVTAATAYLARNKAQDRNAWLHATVDHAAQAFLGLTMQCARCHDHPVEAITQVEYFRMRAVFEPYQIRTDPLPGPAPVVEKGKKSGAPKDGVTRAFDANLAAKTFLFIRGNELEPDKTTAIVPGVPALLKTPQPEIREVALTTEKGTVKSSGRRSAFALWLTDARNPLTARVAVNHLWGRHFDTALVTSVSDFGAGGTPPSNPALLDWLAAEFVQSGWKMKPLHRLIVTSAVYRSDSTPHAGNFAQDPDNRRLWRFPHRRMEAELVRDALLFTAGRLDATLGGPSIKVEQGDSQARRSLYFHSSPYTQMMFLVTFDGGAVQECYERTESIQPQQALALLNSRLALESARTLARSMAKTQPDEKAFIDAVFEILLSRRPTDAERRICSEYLAQERRLLAEAPAASKAAATSSPADVSKPSADPALRARENFVHLLFNHHDFVTIR